MAEIYMQELTDLFWTPSDPVEPMWINEDGTVTGITLRSAANAEELRKNFEFGI